MKFHIIENGNLVSLTEKQVLQKLADSSELENASLYSKVSQLIQENAKLRGELQSLTKSRNHNLKELESFDFNTKELTKTLMNHKARIISNLSKGCTMKLDVRIHFYKGSYHEDSLNVLSDNKVFDIEKILNSEDFKLTKEKLEEEKRAKQEKARIKKLQKLKAELQKDPLLAKELGSIIPNVS